MGRIGSREQGGSYVLHSRLVERSHRLVLRKSFKGTTVFVQVGKVLSFSGISGRNSDAGRRVRSVMEVKVFVQCVTKFCISLGGGAKGTIRVVGVVIQSLDVATVKELESVGEAARVGERGILFKGTENEGLK